MKLPLFLCPTSWWNMGEQQKSNIRGFRSKHPLLTLLPRRRPFVWFFVKSHTFKENAAKFQGRNLSPISHSTLVDQELERSCVVTLLFSLPAINFFHLMPLSDPLNNFSLYLKLIEKPRVTQLVKKFFIRDREGSFLFLHCALLFQSRTSYVFTLTSILILFSHVH
jgi:hypothetical protein